MAVGCREASSHRCSPSGPWGRSPRSEGRPKQRGRTTKRHGEPAGGISTITTRSGGQLYDLSKDPFELNNLWNTNLLNNKPEIKKKLLEIREWAEADIGLPEVPVVGAG